MNFGVENIVFIIVLAGAIYFFARSFNKIWRNIKLGRDINRSDRKGERWKLMAKVALGQTKMVRRRLVAGFFHVVIYVGFILINIEVLEIILDGILGTHRLFAEPLGPVYDAAIHFFEILAVGVIVACVVFLWRRNVAVVPRLRDLKGWPKLDGNNILIIELILMIALLSLGAFEANMSGNSHGPWVVSQFMAPWFSGFSDSSLHIMERSAWWLHIVGILLFLNYLPISKHFHIIMAFPNVWYSRLDKLGRFTNDGAVKKEVEMMMDPNADPFAAPAEADGAGEEEEPGRFGAKDVFDLNWVQLMNAYACTECGRCTAACPANMTGKKLSPRKIMMDTRDRLSEVGQNIDKNKGEFQDDGKSLLGDYITNEELWACTTCNACTDACPVNIDPLSIIVDMRRYLVMEESSASQQINMMMTNVENNGAPWAYAQADRANWINE